MGISVKGRIKKGFTLLAGASMLLLSGCANEDAAQSVKEISDKYSVAEENQLIVYTSHKEEVYLPIIQEFENETGIYVDIQAGGTQEMMQQAKSASEKGKCDIMFGGGVESYEAWKDIFEPYESSEKEQLDEAFLSKDGCWTPFTELPIVFVYNKKLVHSSMAPQTWDELLDSKWQGKIAFADMDNSGTSYTIVSTIAQMQGKEPSDVVETIIHQTNGAILKSSGDIIPDVSNGTSLVGITLEETALKAIDRGYNIDMVYPKDGTSAVPDGCGILKNAPHEENAKRFIDFITSSQVQGFAMNQFYRRPIRTDVELREDFGKLNIIDFDVAKSAEDEEATFDRWHQLTGQED
ncbi:iron(III) transport system substrate-binding protein [Pseudobutyrivibrio sp. YE44]|uniref:extracellular solute-binding protein n=1 Tax=Pseudobutyrivibrio sp. YE44 TaxID=1520802 RepID=UPI00087ECF09|nr:extracellular solute-binding protein [Pseudobutyrivibrio sp. YE44]SDB42989.1 iron(III) transport system substrate-binding protein [Pseudobutyrivibrio sp. YE44]